MGEEKSYGSQKAQQFTESVIREMSRIANLYGAINLAQGFPDFPAPDKIKQAAIEAISAEQNQYAITWGTQGLREGIAWKTKRDYDIDLDPDQQITVCCGATEGMMAALLATVNPGDEVIVFQPFYENYGADAILCGAVPKYVGLHAPDFHIDLEELTAAFSDRTRAIIINTPHNPTGKVFSYDELSAIAALCQKFDVLAITDEIYEHILYDGTKHIPLWKLPGMAERTLMINSISKTFSVTGWRVGYVIASPQITQSVRKVHDFLTVGTATPLQVAAGVAMRFDRSYYKELAAFYLERRDFLLQALEKAGFACVKPHGAYYIMADIRSMGWTDDVAFSRYLTQEIGVAPVPGSSFYCPDHPEAHIYIRFCFCKEMATLQKAVDRLAKVKPQLGK